MIEEKEQLDVDELVKMWVCYGDEDLYFGFCVEYEPHEDYALFAEIMGFEKILKAYLLYAKREDYLSKDSPRKELENLIKNEWGHKFKVMLKLVNQNITNGKLSELIDKDYDGFTGKQFINILEKGYMELRYPVPNPSYEGIKVKAQNIYSDPLGSSGATKFIHEISRFIFQELREDVALSEINKQFLSRYSSREQTARFINILFKGKIDEYL